MEEPRADSIRDITLANIKPVTGTGIIDKDPYLEPQRGHFEYRSHRLKETLAHIEKYYGSLEQFSRGYEKYGFNRTTQDGKPGILYREWAPNAKHASLVGDFNSWMRGKHSMIKDEKTGVFEIFIPDHEDGTPAIPHNSPVKIALYFPDDTIHYRLPAWATYSEMDKGTNSYISKYWCPPASERHQWKHPRPQWVRRYAAATVLPAGSKVTRHTEERKEAEPLPEQLSIGYGDGQALRVYESHVGMSSEKEEIATYRYFADNILARVKKMGYNCVQLMAIMEHAYYASFGYHITSFFGASSRFGTPEDLKYLVDKAHGMGLMVIMDLVHSHASKNVDDGLNMQDGSDYQYFHTGARGNHELWDSRLFNYGKEQVLEFLLSNVRFFVEEYRFDGFRFDGVTSILYHHHGIGTGFSGDYNEYFGPATDADAVTYLQLTNLLLHSMDPPALTIAEDVSGMPGLCRPPLEGGVGFDYRMGMAVPDMWIKLLKESKDEDWKMGDIAFQLLNRRHDEKTIAYAESHDQALVGDKTIAFWLMDKEMYTHMSTLSPPNPIVDRGIALHKMIRLLTMALGGEGYLTFMGNEFGHPEWIDFPRAGNNDSYKHCRRQWNLMEDPLLKYKFLYKFEESMQALENTYNFVLRSDYVSRKHEGDKVIVFDKGPLLFVFNFHSNNSYPDYLIGAPETGRYQVVLNSDSEEHGGFNRIDDQRDYIASPDPWDNRPASMKVYIPCRCAIVFAKAGTKPTM